MFNVIAFHALVKVFLPLDMAVCKSDVMMFADIKDGIVLGYL